MKNLWQELSFFCWLLLLLPCCQGQQRPAADAATEPKPLVGGPFENSGFGLIGRPAEIMPVDTSPAWAEEGQRLLIRGTIFQLDGKTPAPGTILYYYHTNVEGFYAAGPGLPPAVRRHGYLRGWVKADKAGQYAIYTVRPGAYPNRGEPAHLHVSVYETSGLNTYYLDEWVFDDDPLLSAAKREALPNRGGSGVLRPHLQGDLLVAEHDVVLGLNIPNYPTQ